MVQAALNGELNEVDMVQDPVFGVSVPVSCPDVPPEVLNPRNTWNDQQAYDIQARKLAVMFTENFKVFSAQVSADVNAAGPKILNKYKEPAKNAMPVV